MQKKNAIDWIDSIAPDVSNHLHPDVAAAAAVGKLN